jgi:hypothetical protein
MITAKNKTEELLLRLKRINIDLRKNYPNIQLTDASIGKGSDKITYQGLIELGVPVDFITPNEHFFGYSIKWKAKPETGIDAGGAIKILEITDIFGDWEGQTYFQNTPEDSTLRDFKPVDVKNEYGDNLAGIYFGKNKTDYTFHYGDIDGSEYRSLDLDINGYIEMMIMAKGCYGWQTAIIDIIYIDAVLRTGDGDDFKENMPKLFPDWTWEGFVQKFEEVRLKKVK